MEEMEALEDQVQCRTANPLGRSSCSHALIVGGHGSGGSGGSGASGGAGMKPCPLCNSYYYSLFQLQEEAVDLEVI